MTATVANGYKLNQILDTNHEIQLFILFCISGTFKKHRDEINFAAILAVTKLLPLI